VWWFSGDVGGQAQCGSQDATTPTRGPGALIHPEIARLRRENRARVVALFLSHIHASCIALASAWAVMA
jgi:hypothetical protein